MTALKYVLVVFGSLMMSIALDLSTNRSVLFISGLNSVIFAWLLWYKEDRDRT